MGVFKTSRYENVALPERHPILHLIYGYLP
jgi:hypothetical protein